MSQSRSTHPPAVIIGCDHAAYALKEKIKAHLAARKIEVEDAGTYGEAAVDYPDIARKVAAPVSSGAFKRGILLCGSGIGMSIMANRFRGVRAALCNDLFSALLSRRHNDANILALGARIVGEGLALEIVDAWLATAFDGGRHTGRIEKFDHNESQAVS